MFPVISKGFTLVELVVVIIILSIVGLATTSYIATGVNIYTGVADRDKSINSLRFVIERMRREVAEALPNSAKVENGCLKFAPIMASSIYGNNFPILPISSDTATIASVTDTNYAFTKDDRVAVYVLGNNDLYTNEGLLQNSTQVRTITAIGNDSLTFSSDDSFTLGSPAKRFFIIRNTVDYCFKNNTIVRSENEGAEVLMANNISGSFTVSNATLQRNALVQVKFLLDFDDQKGAFEETLHINNVP